MWGFGDGTRLGLLPNVLAFRLHAVAPRVAVGAAPQPVERILLGEAGVAVELVGALAAVQDVDAVATGFTIVTFGEPFVTVSAASSETSEVPSSTTPPVSTMTGSAPVITTEFTNTDKGRDTFAGNLTNDVRVGSNVVGLGEAKRYFHGPPAAVGVRGDVVVAHGPWEALEATRQVVLKGAAPPRNPR